MSSTSAPFASLVLIVSASLAGCLKPEERLDEYAARVVDASTILNTCSGDSARQLGPARAIADVSGEFLLAISVSLSPSSPLQFRCTTALSPAGDQASLDLSCLPLVVDDEDTAEDERAPIGDAIGQDDVLVASNGTFCATLIGSVPGAANPISGSAITTAPEGLELSGAIGDDDFCGTFAGAITEPFATDINGTFGAVRATPGATGADLPAPVAACP